MAVSIRGAEVADLDAVRAIARAAYAPYVPRIGREPAPMVADFAPAIAAGHVWVAEEAGNAVAGYAVAWPRGDHWHLENVAVLPVAQGRSVGRALIAHVEQRAQESGAAAVELYTNAKMTENRVLYPRLGYRETGRATEDGFDRVYYRKEFAGTGG